MRRTIEELDLPHVSGRPKAPHRHTVASDRRRRSQSPCLGSCNTQASMRESVIRYLPSMDNWYTAPVDLKTRMTLKEVVQLMHFAEILGECNDAMTSNKKITPAEQ